MCVEVVQRFNWLDWLVVLSVVAGLVLGYLRGLLGVVVGLFGYLVSLLVAGRFAGPAAQWQEPYIGLIGTLTRMMHANIKLPQDLAQAPLGQLPAERVAQLIAFLPVPEFYKGYLTAKLMALVQAEGHRAVADVLFSQIATGVVAAGLFLLITALVGWGLAVLAGRLSGVLDHVPLVGTANRWLGALVGGAEVVVGAALLLALLNPVLALPFAQKFALAVAESHTAGWLMDVYAALAAWFFGRGNAFFLGL